MKSASIIVIVSIVFSLSSCSKTKEDVFIPCSEKRIEISILTSPTAGCIANTGTIKATATGSRGFTFRLNSAAFQSTGNFANLSNGNYNITVRDADGCEQSAFALVESGIAAGPKFAALKSLLVAKCTRCHSGVTPAALKDWRVDCTVLQNKELINNRAVLLGDMPKGGPVLTTAEKAVITDWISAGGKIDN